MPKYVAVETTNGSELDAVPLAINIDADGKPVYEITGVVESELCQHAGAAWSQDLDVRCPHCGAPLFLPPRLLAGLAADIIETMHQLWREAGNPHWWNGAMDGYGQIIHGWRVDGERWLLVEQPLFERMGGLAVRADRLERFATEGGVIGGG